MTKHTTTTIVGLSAVTIALTLVVSHAHAWHDEPPAWELDHFEHQNRMLEQRMHEQRMLMEMQRQTQALERKAEALERANRQRGRAGGFDW